MTIDIIRNKKILFRSFPSWEGLGVGKTLFSICLLFSNSHSHNKEDLLCLVGIVERC